MNAPREPDQQDDALLAAYHRASTQEGHAPDPRVRERILAQVRRDHAPAAANDGRWRARAVAGVAVLGLVGWLARQGLRDAPHPADATVRSDSLVHTDTMAAAAAPVAPAPVTAPAEQRPGPAQAAARVSVAQPAANIAAMDSVQRAAAPRALASRAAATSDGATSDEAPGDETLVRRAVSTRFAGLFLPRDSDHLNLVIVLMDRSGGIARSAVKSASVNAAVREQPGAAGDFQSLGLRADEIAAPGFIELSEPAASAGAPDKVLLVRYAWTRESGQ